MTVIRMKSSIGRDVVAEVEAKFLVQVRLQLDRLFDLLQRAGYSAEPRRNESIVDRYSRHVGSAHPACGLGVTACATATASTPSASSR
jgi:hypothetical protein